MKPFEAATAKAPLPGAEVAAGATPVDEAAAELAAAAARDEAEAMTDAADEAAAGAAELEATVPEAAATHWALASVTRDSEQSDEQCDSEP